ncbi:MAG: ATP-dependent helicase HrpB [Gammaproteobacteria bacterium]|nr:MAG: ATP-dependent helicase HrpB [Gammaproteobacteria bacterium]
MPLPVEHVMPELFEALVQSHAVLASPPGSGKTTRVPLALLQQPWLSGKKILMLEPRRPAVRMAAAYMAGQLGEKPGETVGYRMRMERRVGPHTRIEVLTEGLFIRKLQEDPELTGVGLVIFDEFHEQSLDSELGLSLCLDVCDALREELRLLVMSATLDEQAVADLIGGKAIVSDGGLHPVTLHHLSRSAGREVLPATHRLIHRALREQEGDVLVFLPGKGEINRLEARLKEELVPADLFQLHGEMDAASQALVLTPQPAHRRRVILATDVAETSLTIEGISSVVDSGLARKPVFDPNSGLSRLTTQPIPQASASQRAGRAGRLGPGTCYRAWTETEHGSRPFQRPAEIRQADLAPLVLQLALWGVTGPGSLHWLNPPPAPAWRQGVALLEKLEALDGEGRITPHGREMAVTGLHPRLAHMLIRGGRNSPTAADLAALLSDRDPWRRGNQPFSPVDIGLRLDALEAMRQGSAPRHHFDAHRLRQLLQLSDRLRSRTRHLDAATAPFSAATLLSLAYPERIARRRDAGSGRYPGFLTTPLEIGLFLLHKARATKHLPATRERGL